MMESAKKSLQGIIQQYESEQKVAEGLVYVCIRMLIYQYTSAAVGVKLATQSRSNESLWH